jgi:hypothetical protein
MRKKKTMPFKALGGSDESLSGLELIRALRACFKGGPSLVEELERDRRLEDFRKERKFRKLLKRLEDHKR